MLSLFRTILQFAQCLSLSLFVAKIKAVNSFSAARLYLYVFVRIRSGRKSVAIISRIGVQFENIQTSQQRAQNNNISYEIVYF